MNIAWWVWPFFDHTKQRCRNKTMNWNLTTIDHYIHTYIHTYSSVAIKRWLLVKPELIHRFGIWFSGWGNYRHSKEPLVVTSGYYNQGSYNQRFLQPEILQPGFLTTRGLTTSGSNNQGSHKKRFLQPGILQPGVLTKGVLQPGVFTTRGVTTRGSYNQGSYR